MAVIQKLALLFALFFHTFCSAATIDRKENGIITARQVSRGSLQQVTSFGSNPTNVGFYIYVPNNLAWNPGIIVAIHYCTGTAQAYYSGSPYATYAEQYGFIVIYPSSPYSGTCWDVSSQSALTHNGGGDSNSIANMVTWTISQYSADTSKVFVTGTSSGAMMTNVMAATYPELFAAGSLYSGVAAGCFMSNTNQVDGWNSSCADGDVVSTPQYWASVAENMYPGYTGSRPKMQIYHGSADTTLYPPNYNETCKQWAGVFGYDYNSPQQVISNDPQSQYFTTIWGPNLQGIYAIGVGHTVPIHGPQDMEWFGFAGGSTTTTTTTTAKPTTTTSVTSTKTTSSTTTTTTTGTSGCTQAHWDQCGGIQWTGCTVCASPYTCKESNAYYSQCL